MTLKTFYSQLHSRSQVIHQNHIRQIVYLNYLTTHAFILAITFAPFSCDLSKFFTLIYSLFAFSFISLPVMKSMCNTPKYLYLPRLTLSYAFHQIMRFPLSEPSFASSRLVPYTCLDEMQYQHYLKKLARSGYTNQFSLTLCTQIWIVLKNRWFNFCFCLVTYQRSVSFKIINEGRRPKAKMVPLERSLS